jgi:hypothetical protein
MGGYLGLAMLRTNMSVSAGIVDVSPPAVDAVDAVGSGTTAAVTTVEDIDKVGHDIFKVKGFNRSSLFI